MKLQTRPTLRDALLLIVVNVLWGGSAVAAKAALGGFDAAEAPHLQPHTLALLRFSTAALLLLAFQRIRGETVSFRREDRAAFVWTGILGTSAAYSLFYQGAALTSASEMNLLVAAEPILIAVLGWRFLGERLSPAKSAGMLLGFLGIYLILARGITLKFGGSSVGNSVVLAALSLESIGAVISKRLAASYDGINVVLGCAVPGCIGLLPFAVWELVNQAPYVSVSALCGLLYLALVCSTFCYGVWFMYVPRFGISTLSVFLFIQPVVAPLYGRIFLGETVPLITLLGASITLCGVWLVARESAPLPSGMEHA
jgi:drug/metabolite transporter (DMT)-like permease